jgi:hypothetical protein
MKLLFIVLFVTFINVIYAQKKYTDRFDNVNVDQILKNDRILTNYVKCLLEKGNYNFIYFFYNLLVLLPWFFFGREGV